MRTSTALIAFCTLVTFFVSADLHSDAVCFDNIGGQNVYNEAATKAACTSYLNRNTGSEQWDTCPDCTMVCPSERRCLVYETNMPHRKWLGT
jgi:hypothetical protein